VGHLGGRVACGGKGAARERARCRFGGWDDGVVQTFGEVGGSLSSQHEPLKVVPTGNSASGRHHVLGACQRGGEALRLAFGVICAFCGSVESFSGPPALFLSLLADCILALLPDEERELLGEYIASGLNGREVERRLGLNHSTFQAQLEKAMKHAAIAAARFYQTSDDEAPEQYRQALKSSPSPPMWPSWS